MAAHRIPSNLKVLHGTARRGSVNPAEPKERCCNPDPPEGMSPEAAKIFADLATRLYGMRVMTESAVPALAIAADTIARLRELRAATPATAVNSAKSARVMGLEVTYRKEAFAQLAHFGLTPASRASVSVVDGGGSELVREMFG